MKYENPYIVQAMTLRDNDEHKSILHIVVFFDTETAKLMYLEFNTMATLFREKCVNEYDEYMLCEMTYDTLDALNQWAERSYSSVTYDDPYVKLIFDCWNRGLSKKYVYVKLGKKPLDNKHNIW